MMEVQPLAAGEEGEQVEELQRRLRHLGHYEGEIDGRYGDRTEQAVREFQSRSGTPEDGRIEPETWEVLDREAQFAGYDPYAAGQSGYDQPADDQSYGYDQSAYDQQGEAGADGTEAARLSEDGRWRWDGSDWQPVDGQTGGDEARSTETGQLSEDGRWRWDGSDWQPVEGHEQQPGTHQPAGEHGGTMEDQATDQHAGEKPPGQDTAADASNPPVSELPPLDVSMFDGEEFDDFREFLQQNQDIGESSEGSTV